MKVVGEEEGCLCRKKKKPEETWVNEDYHSATWFDSIYTLEVWVVQYPMIVSTLLCLTGTCFMPYINVCWYFWRTHRGTMFHLHSGNEHPSFPSRAFSDLFPWVSDLSLPPTSPGFLPQNWERDCLEVFTPACSKKDQHWVQTMLLRGLSIKLLEIYRNRYFTAPLGNLLQWLIVSMVWLFIQFLLRFWLTHSLC